MLSASAVSGRARSRLSLAYKSKALAAASAACSGRCRGPGGVHGSSQRVGFLDRSQALLVPPQRPQIYGEVGQEGVETQRGQPAVGGDRFLCGGQAPLAPPEFPQIDSEVVQAPREVGQEGIGTRHGQLPADGDGFLDGGQALLAPELHINHWPSRM